MPSKVGEKKGMSLPGTSGNFSLTLGGIYDAVRPDPFPNSVVKRVRADDSLVHASAKVGSCRL